MGVYDGSGGGKQRRGLVGADFSMNSLYYVFFLSFFISFFFFFWWGEGGEWEECKFGDLNGAFFTLK